MRSEEELVKKCGQGDSQSQKLLYDTYCRRLLAICMRYVKTRAEAEDIMQEAFIKIFTHIKEFRFESKLLTWMTRIVIHTALNHQRQKLYLLPILDLDRAEVENKESITLSDFHLSDLYEMVQNLPDGCRWVFNLFAVEGYSHKEIAQMLQISEGTSKSQYHRAKSLLKQSLELNARKYGI